MNLLSTFVCVCVYAYVCGFYNYFPFCFSLCFLLLHLFLFTLVVVLLLLLLSFSVFYSCSFVFVPFFFFFFLLYVCFHAFLLQLPNLTKLPFSFLAYLSFCHEFSRFSIASYVTSYRSIIIIPFTSSSLAFPFFFFSSFLLPFKIVSLCLTLRQIQCCFNRSFRLPPFFPSLDNHPKIRESKRERGEMIQREEKGA